MRTRSSDCVGTPALDQSRLWLKWYIVQIPQRPKEVSLPQVFGCHLIVFDFLKLNCNISSFFNQIFSLKHIFYFALWIGPYTMLFLLLVMATARTFPAYPSRSNSPRRGGSHPMGILMGGGGLLLHTGVWCQQIYCHFTQVSLCQRGLRLLRVPATCTCMHPSRPWGRGMLFSLAGSLF